MMKFVEVQHDTAFHKIFGNPDKPVALISFLNAVFYPDGVGSVVKVNVEHPYLYPPVPAGRTSIINLEATDDEGRVFLVEMQVADRQGFGARTYFYDRIAMARIAEGRSMRKPACLICILDFNFTQNPNYFSIHQTMDTETGEHLLKDTKYFFIELPKFNKREDELVSILDKWTYFIKNAPNLDVIPSNVDDDGLKAAYLDADQQTWTKAERILMMHSGFI
jgi:predicted transposase/invertase (TIGR01784 family)